MTTPRNPKRRPHAPPAPGWRAPVLLALAAFLVYCANCRWIGAIDTLANELVPVVLVTRGNLDLAEFDVHFGGKPEGSGFAQKSRFGYLPAYPVASGLALTPLYALPVARHAESQPTLEEWIGFAKIAGKVAAAAIVAISVAVFLVVCRRLGAAPPLALGLTLAYAFGSSAWSISAQALWQHGPSVLLLLLTILATHRQGHEPTRRGALGWGLLAGLAVAVRLTNALFVAPLAVWLLLRRREHGIAMLAPLAAFTMAVVLYNLAVYEHPLGLYGYTPLDAPFAAGLAGVLLSPGRGLLLYFPLALLGFAGLAVVASRLRHERGGPLPWWPLGVFVVLQLVTVARFFNWWGGVSFGSRLTSEIQPVLLLLAIPLFAQWPGRRRLALAALAGLFAAWSVLIQAFGAFLYTGEWDGSPVFVDHSPERLWHWADNPVTRELTADRLRWAVFRPHPLTEFEAQYTAPERATVVAGEPFALPVKLRNTGTERWLPYGKENRVWAVHLGYHLAPLAAVAQRSEGDRTRLPEIVSPGEEVSVDLQAVAPAEPGEYLLEVGLLQEVVDWFESRGSAPASVVLSVVPKRGPPTKPEPPP